VTGPGGFECPDEEAWIVVVGCTGFSVQWFLFSADKWFLDEMSAFVSSTLLFGNNVSIIAGAVEKVSVHYTDIG
jgi:hypothetical protein